MVYLEPGQLEALKKRAQSQRISTAELLRRIVRRYLTERPQRKVPSDVYARVVGLGASGHADISDQHDRRIGEALRREHLR